MTTRLTALIGSLLLLLGTSACGGDDESEPSAEDQRRTKAVTAIAKQITKDNDLGDDSEPIYSKDETTCLATTLVDRVGIDAMVKQGILEEDLTVIALPDQGSKKYQRAMVHGISDCIGIVDVAVRLGMIFARMVTEGRGEEFDDSDTDSILACAQQKITEAQAKKDALRQIRTSSNRMLSEGLTQRLKECDPALAQ